MTDEITESLCRLYPISCPACGNEYRFRRLKPDIYRARNQEPDGHPLEIGWRTEGEFPGWVTPLNYFWTVCDRCFYTAQVDDSDFRQWKKQSKKFLAQFHEAALEGLAGQADTDQGVAQALGKAIQPDDLFGTLLITFFLGIFSECLKTAPVSGSLGRAYLRIAWIYRDAERLYKTSLEEAKVLPFLDKLAPSWAAELPPNSHFPVQPEIVTDEVSALRQALAFFEWNFASLQSAGHEDEMRLMTLIAEVGYRIYEVTGLDEDFTKGQSFFSGTMQKCQSVMNNKNIVGGAVNRAKDTLGKAGERSRELRALKQQWEKNSNKPSSEATAVTAVEPEPQPAEAPAEAPADPKLDPVPDLPPSVPVLGDAGPGEMRDLQKKITQLNEENKRWMRLAGISELTGLPNRVMLSRVLLPSALKQASARREPLGCILISPEGLTEINGKYGRSRGDILIAKFCDCLKELLRKGERLCHLEGVNFALVVPKFPPRQLQKRAESLHKTLTQRRFELDGEAFSLKVSIGVAGLAERQQG